MLVEDILREIDAALERRGISARAASIRAQGAPEMIRDMRRGHVPSVERLRSLCEVLGLEFYVGPPRWRLGEDGGALPDVPLHALERSARDLVRLSLLAGGNPIPEDLWPTFLAMARREVEGSRKETHVIVPTTGTVGVRSGTGRIVKVPASDALTGLPRDQWGAPEVSPVEFAILAGQFIGVEDATVEPDVKFEILNSQEKDKAYRDWLKGHGFDPALCTVVEIADEAMEPTLPAGCLTMVDSTNTGWDPPCIKAVQRGEDVVFRRVDIDDRGQRVMVCDHPDWPDEPWPADARIVGQAKWVGRWLD